MANDYLNKILVGKTAQGEVTFIGWCVGYCDAPTVNVVTPEGEVVGWRADLCRIADLEPKAVELLSKICQENRTKLEAKRG